MSKIPLPACTRPFPSCWPRNLFTARYVETAGMPLRTGAGAPQYRIIARPTVPHGQPADASNRV